MARLTLKLCANIGRIAPERYHGGLREAAREWIDWPTIFQELLVQGRIWDFKDLYVAAVAAFSDPQDRLLLGTDDIKRSLIDDWVLETGDESTNLALLDMLLEPAHLRSYYPDEIKSRAEAIIAHSPAVMRSRSFIRWILANAADALSGKKKGDDDSWLAFKTHLQGFPGVVWNTEGCVLPGVYVPRNIENPGWVAPDPPLGMNEPIQLALNLAKQLKDYNAQVACYKLLIFQSQDPTKLFQELAELQKSMQGDREGHLETLMCSYLVSKDRPSREKLLEELEQSGDWGDATMLTDGLTYWARDFIERAVKRSLEGPRSTARLRNPADFYMDKGLSWEVKEFTWQNTELDRFPTTSVHPTETHIRQTPAFRAYQQQRMRPYSQLSSSYREYVSSLEPFPQALTDSRRDELYYDRRQREETERQENELVRARRDLEAAKEKRELEQREKEERELDRARRELQTMKEKQEREVKNQQDRETRERLAQAEQRLREQEEINKKQIEEMKRREMEIGRLEQDFKQAKERQELEARAQQERQTRERLERAELSLRDQAERLRRAEDRSYQEWLSRRDFRHESNARGKLMRGRRGIRFVAASSSSSESYFSDRSPSRDDENSSDGTSTRRRRKENTTDSSDSEDESDQETRIHRRSSRDGELRSEPRRDEDDGQDGNDTVNLQQNSCTDLILYTGTQDIRSPDAQMTEDPLLRPPQSPVSLPGEARSGSRRSSTTEPVRNPSQFRSRPDIILT